jgi:muconate cycloisomerase
MVALRNKTKVPMVADTSALSVNEAYNLVKLQAVDCCHGLICRIGGLRRTIKWTNLLDIAFIDFQLCHLGNSVANAAAAHLAVTRGKSNRFNDELAIYLYLHGTTDTKSITDDIIKEPGGVIEDGYLYPPKGPGLGIELDEEMLSRYASKDISTIVVK